MRKLLGKGFLLGLAIVLVLVGYGFWHFSRPDAGAPEVRSAGRLLWPATHRTIRALEQEVRHGKSDAASYRRLGYAYIQHARQTGEGSYNDKAQDAFAEALKQNPKDFEAMSGMGVVYLTRHQFQEALAWGQRSLAANPHRALTYGILVDAYIELGRYDEAVEAAQKMVDTRPDLASYSRVSYVRELMGDMEGAIDAMRRAVSAGSGDHEHAVWCRVYLGHLYFHQGDLAEAEKHYQIALQQLPYYGHALAGLGRVRLMQERFGEAVTLYEEAVGVFPIGEYVVALGDAYAAAGQPQEAEAQYAQAIGMLEDERAGGMDVDEELAALLLERDREVGRALALAEGAYARRPTVKNADVLAWAQFKTGHPERAFETARQALRLGTQHAALYYHAGRIAEALGKRDAARQHLRQALAINPYFSRRGAQEARKHLAELQQQTAAGSAQ